MHNETKVNTKISAVATAEAKNNIFARKHIGIIDMPYGVQLVDSGAAIDHAAMRGHQLSSLLLLIQGDDSDRLRSLGPTRQDSLIWLATQLAEEMEAMIEMIVADAQGVSA